MVQYSRAYLVDSAGEIQYYDLSWLFLFCSYVFIYFFKHCLYLYYNTHLNISGWVAAGW